MQPPRGGGRFTQLGGGAGGRLCLPLPGEDEPEQKKEKPGSASHGRHVFTEVGGRGWRHREQPVEGLGGWRPSSPMELFLGLSQRGISAPVLCRRAEPALAPEPVSQPRKWRPPALGWVSTGAQGRAWQSLPILHPSRPASIPSWPREAEPGVVRRLCWRRGQCPSWGWVGVLPGCPRIAHPGRPFEPGQEFEPPS